MSDKNAEKVMCGRESCVNCRDGYCALKNPERDGDNCLHYEDTLNSLRLKVDTFKGTLRR
ncbi:MAG: hypothetical protein V1850_02565 [Candidatus Bathyarchaeota archaeon]